MSNSITEIWLTVLIVVTMLHAIGLFYIAMGMAHVIVMEIYDEVKAKYFS